MLQYNQHVRNVCEETVNKQEDNIKLAFDLVHGRSPWQGDHLLSSGAPKFEPGKVGPDSEAQQLFTDCISWLRQAVKRLHTRPALEAFDRVRQHVLLIAKCNDFEIPLHTHMWPLLFHLGLIYNEAEMGVVLQHYRHVNVLPASGQPFIGIVISCNADAPEFRANHEFFKELSEHVRTKMYIVNGDASGFEMGMMEVMPCIGMSHTQIAEQVRSDNPILVLNASATSLDVTKLGVAPRVMQFIGVDVPVFNRNWITHRYMNSEQRRRLVSTETPVVVNHYHHMAKIDDLNPDTERIADGKFRVSTHFRDIKSSTQLTNTIIAVANAHESVEVVVSTRDATGCLMNIDNERVVGGWFPSMDDPNPFREQYDLVVDSPVSWSMHHTMLVWMRAGVPIAVVKPMYDTVFSAHSTDMLTMIGMKADLFFEDDESLVQKIHFWIENPSAFADVKRRYENAVRRIPSNREAARNFYNQIMQMGLLSNEGLAEDAQKSEDHEPSNEPTEPSEHAEHDEPVPLRTAVDDAAIQTGGSSNGYLADTCLFGCTLLFAIASSIIITS